MTHSDHRPCTGCSPASRRVVAAGRRPASPTPCAAQAVPVTEVDWQPPMAGTAADLARVLADPRRDEANAEALRG